MVQTGKLAANRRFQTARRDQCPQPIAGRRQCRCGLSTGNHGRGLAYAGRVRLGIRVVVCMSSLVPAVKVEGICKLGAEVHIHGASQDEAQGEVDRLIAEEGLFEVGPSTTRR